MLVRLFGELIDGLLKLSQYSRGEVQRENVNLSAIATRILEELSVAEPQRAVEWEIELMSLDHLRSYGWMRTTVKSGDVISATGGAAKSGAPSMISAVIELPDGRKIRS